MTINVDMRVGWVLLLLCLVSKLVSADDSASGVGDYERAEYNWVMHCRGCHGVDAKGSKGGAPNLDGEVSIFLHSAEGRSYLGRVPGVAFVSLPDDELAELLNWLTHTFDKPGIPSDFKPYSAKEIKSLRQRPLISNAFKEREKVLNHLISKKTK